VPDIRRSIEDLGAAGVTFRRFEGMEQDEQGIWRAPSGSLIAWFTDPDGNTISLQQAPQG
jgi:catechol 2,3-dioxygenase-like lactoylglutathione lyase family enzyme